MEKANDSENNIIAGFFKKNASTAVCSGIWINEGFASIFIRAFAQAIDEDGWTPLKEGINLPIARYDELLEGINKLKEVMGGDKTVAVIQKSKDKAIHISFCTYQDIPLVNLRTYQQNAKTGDSFPTKQGIAIRVEQLPELIEITEKLGEEVKKYQAANVG